MSSDQPVNKEFVTIAEIDARISKLEAKAARSPTWEKYTKHQDEAQHLKQERAYLIQMRSYHHGL